MRELSTPRAVPVQTAGSLADAVYDHAALDPHRIALHRKVEGVWVDVSAQEFHDDVMMVAKGLLAQGIRFGDRVAVMSRTRYEWTLFDFALWSIGALPVPLNPTASIGQAAWILGDARVTACVVEDESHAMTVGSLMGRLPELRHLWQLDTGAVDELIASGAGVDDRAVHRRRMGLGPDSLASVVYTAGTTGRPKGCVLTHANFMAVADNFLHTYEWAFRPTDGAPANALLGMPLGHAVARVVQVASVRGRIGFGHHAPSSLAELLEDLRALRPSFMLAAPSDFQQVFAFIRQEAETQGRVGAFGMAVDVAVEYGRALERKAVGAGRGPGPRLQMQHQLFDGSVYGRVREVLGGRMEHALLSGPGMQRRLGLLFAGAGVTLHESYGLTESTGLATAHPPRQARFGTVGKPMPGSIVHIDEEGQIWLHGHQNFSGYLGDSERTAATLVRGWLATGDLGSLDGDGYLTIEGRHEEAVVTTAGCRIRPLPLEQRIQAHPLIAHCMIVGNRRPHLGALITLDRAAVAHWLKMCGKRQRSGDELLVEPGLQAEIRRAVAGANEHAPEAAHIRTFRILAGQFTEELGLLSASLQLRRQAITERFRTEIDALYDP